MERNKLYQLFYAVGKKDLRLLKRQLKKSTIGIIINHQNIDLDTVLHVVLSQPTLKIKTRTEMAIALLNHQDINVQIRNCEGDTALHLAIGDSNFPVETRKAIINMILDKVDPNDRKDYINSLNNQGFSALHLTILGTGLKGRECSKIVLHLVELFDGINANLLDNENYTALHEAILVTCMKDNERLALIDALLTIKGIEVYEPALTKETPLHTVFYATILNKDMRKEVIMRLVDKMKPGSDLSVTDIDGNSIESLLEDPNNLTKEGKLEIIAKLKSKNIWRNTEEVQTSPGILCKTIPHLKISTSGEFLGRRKHKLSMSADTSKQTCSQYQKRPTKILKKNRSKTSRRDGNEMNFDGKESTSSVRTEKSLSSPVKELDKEATGSDDEVAGSDDKTAGSDDKTAGSDVDEVAAGSDVDEVAAGSGEDEDAAATDEDEAAAGTDEDEAAAGSGEDEAASGSGEAADSDKNSNDYYEKDSPDDSDEEVVLDSNENSYQASLADSDKESSTDSDE